MPHSSRRDRPGAGPGLAAGWAGRAAGFRSLCANWAPGCRAAGIVAGAGRPDWAIRPRQRAAASCWPPWPGESSSALKPACYCPPGRLARNRARLQDLMAASVSASPPRRAHVICLSHRRRLGVPAAGGDRAPLPGCLPRAGPPADLCVVISAQIASLGEASCQHRVAHECRHRVRSWPGTGLLALLGGSSAACHAHSTSCRLRLGYPDAQGRACARGEGRAESTETQSAESACRSVRWIVAFAYLLITNLKAQAWAAGSAGPASPATRTESPPNPRTALRRRARRIGPTRDIRDWLAPPATRRSGLSVSGVAASA